MIELEHLSKRYGGTTAVDDLSLRVAAGELLVLLGESGCGKTTTLKMINRLIEPTAGHVRIDGEPAESLPPHVLRRRIGYVFQKIGLFPHLTVAENVAMTPVLLGWDRARIRARVDALLELVELEPALAAPAAAGALGRAAAARRRRARAGGRAPRDAARRAVRRARPAHAHPAAGVASRASAAGCRSPPCS